MITPSGDVESSELVDGFSPELRVARVPLADPEAYRARLSHAEWQHAATLDGKRLIEHVAGRVAARAAVRALCGERAFDIVRDDDGAPHVTGVDVQISISHGRRSAVAVCARDRAIGIDLCDYDDAARVRRVAARFLCAEENALPRDDAQWCALWALKEAAAKALRKGLFDGGLRASRIAVIDPATFAWPELAAMVVHGERDVIALAVAR
jgi:4'-phosphopantetheinyl transferase EntD